MRRTLNGQALIPSVCRLANDILYEARRRKNSGYCPPMFMYQSCVSKANICIIRNTAPQSSTSVVNNFSKETLLKAFEALTAHHNSKKKKKKKKKKKEKKKKQKATSASNKTPSNVGKKKRGRPRPRMSDKESNYKAETLLEGAEPGTKTHQANPQPT
ncbi:unnamed protein product [Cyberlindnera jadinii]|uniref:Uncharacterized protein n=1 Tax=Cyberlindnera jadinii (strain ATCC 18201 / CBS 1600 / BCRC 20928 / JCM 3617 / NBRC 0987 / NRRL Y-1542) TaxID=983966 RepID=A0A0H5CB64_CYBJN|nr:unnamed protein product [Cyberlindnera jadinii]